MKQLGLDLRALEPGFKAHFGRGTGRYAEALKTHLIPLAQFSNEVNVNVVTSKALGASKFETKLLDTIPLGRVTLEQQVLLPRRLKRLPLDLLHFPSHVDAPVRCPLPYIVTVLDLIPLRFPELYSQKGGNWRFKLARALELQAIRKAIGLITISEASKRDIVELLNIPANKIIVTPLAASEEFTPTAEPKSILRSKFGLAEHDSIFLYVGGIDPRKNVSFLIDFIEAVVAQNKHSHLKPLLLLAGRYDRDKHFPDLQKRIERSTAKQFIRLLGYVADENLPDLYSAADIFIFPSLYEGFGLPVLEAMSCGTPILAANNSSIPEVVGENYPLLPDNQLQPWVEEAFRLLTDTGHRQRMQKYGKSRASQFSWDRTAELTLQAYQTILGSTENRKHVMHGSY